MGRPPGFTHSPRHRQRLKDRVREAMQRPDVKAKLRRPRATARRLHLLDELRALFATPVGRTFLDELIASHFRGQGFDYAVGIKNGRDPNTVQSAPSVDAADVRWDPVQEIGPMQPIATSEDVTWWLPYERRRKDDKLLHRVDEDRCQGQLTLETLRTLARQIELPPGVTWFAVPRVGRDRWGPTVVENTHHFDELVTGRERRHQKRTFKIGRKK